MKKSLIYKCAQASVLNDNRLTDNNKLEILRELMDKEDVAIYCEKKEEEEKVAQAV